MTLAVPVAVGPDSLIFPKMECRSGLHGHVARRSDRIMIDFDGVAMSNPTESGAAAETIRTVGLWQVPALGAGTWALGGPWEFPGAPAGWGVRDFADIVRLAEGPPLKLHHRHRTIARLPRLARPEQLPARHTNHPRLRAHGPGAGAKADRVAVGAIIGADVSRRCRRSGSASCTTTTASMRPGIW